MNTYLSLALCASTFLLSHGVAQEAPPSNKPSAPVHTGQVVHIITHDVALVKKALGYLSKEVEIPELEEGKHLELIMLGDGNTTVELRNGTRSHSVVQLAPPQLMEIYKDKIRQNSLSLQPIFIYTLTQQLELNLADAQNIIDGFANLPNQIQTLNMQLFDNQGSKPGTTRYEIDISSVPDTWLDRTIRLLKPHANGAPEPQEPNPPLSLQLSVDAAGMEETLKPMVRVMAHLGCRNQLTKDRNSAVYDKMLKFQDWSVCLVANPIEKTITTIGALRNPEGMSELLQSKDYATMTNEQGNLHPMAELHLQQNFSKHKEVPLHIITLSGGPQGVVHSFTAVADKYVIQTTQQSKEEVIRIIDNALEHKVKQSPLPGNAMLKIRIDTHQVIALIMPQEPIIAPRNPQTFCVVTVGHSPLGLRITINFE